MGKLLSSSLSLMLSFNIVRTREGRNGFGMRKLTTSPVVFCLSLSHSLSLPLPLSLSLYLSLPLTGSTPVRSQNCKTKRPYSLAVLGYISLVLSRSLVQYLDINPEWKLRVRKLRQRPDSPVIDLGAVGEGCEISPYSLSLSLSLSLCLSLSLSLCNFYICQRNEEVKY